VRRVHLARDAQPSRFPRPRDPQLHPTPLRADHTDSPAPLARGFVRSVPDLPPLVGGPGRTEKGLPSPGSGRILPPSRSPGRKARARTAARRGHAPPSVLWGGAGGGGPDRPPRAGGISLGPGRVAQRESARLTRERSLVQSQPRPPQNVVLRVMPDVPASPDA